MKQEISISEEKLNEIIEQAVKKGLEECIVEQEKKQKKKQK